MQFVSLKFILFLLGVILGYYVIPGRGKKIILLLANAVFYYTFGIQNLCILALMVLVSFGAARVLAKRKEKIYLIFFLVISLLPLVLLKYCDFEGFVEPIGISFFTFKVISYLIDTYQDKLETKHGLWDYSIYVSFFPAITSGPIDRAEPFIRQIQQPKRLEERRLLEGLLYVLWGYFQKMIVSDRLAIIVNTVFDSYQTYAGFPLLVTSVFYTLQIYLDFAGYTFIALGIAKALGYECQQNFRQPYFSMSIREFWQRWHMSLSGWLRDYIYIPLGGNRKGITRKYVNLLLTFLVSGIWHGAGWNFVVWGLLHGSYQVVGALTEKYRMYVKEKLHIANTVLDKGIQMFVTFVLVNFAWILFRGTGGLSGCVDIIRNIFVSSGISFYWLWNTGVVKLEFCIMLAALLCIVVVDILRYHKVKLLQLFFKSPVILQFACIYVLFFAVVLFGVYGPGYDSSAFIYFQF